MTLNTSIGSRVACLTPAKHRPTEPPVPKRSGVYQPKAEATQVMTMKVSKVLEFPVVVLPGVGHMPAPREDEKEAARVFMWRLRGLRRGW